MFHAAARESLDSYSSHHLVFLSEMNWELHDPEREVLVEGQRAALVSQAAKALRDQGGGCCILPSICMSTRLKIPEPLLFLSLQGLLEVF